MVSDGVKYQFCVKCKRLLGTGCSFNKCKKCDKAITEKGK